MNLSSDRIWFWLFNFITYVLIWKGMGNLTDEERSWSLSFCSPLRARHIFSIWERLNHNLRFWCKTFRWWTRVLYTEDHVIFPKSFFLLPFCNGYYWQGRVYCRMTLRHHHFKISDWNEITRRALDRRNFRISQLLWSMTIKVKLEVQSPRTKSSEEFEILSL